MLTALSRGDPRELHSEWPEPHPPSPPLRGRQTAPGGAPSVLRLQQEVLDRMSVGAFENPILQPQPPGPSMPTALLTEMSAVVATAPLPKSLQESPCRRSSESGQGPPAMTSRQSLVSRHHWATGPGACTVGSVVNGCWFSSLIQEKNGDLERSHGEASSNLGLDPSRLCSDVNTVVGAEYLQLLVRRRDPCAPGRSLRAREAVSCTDDGKGSWKPRGKSS